MYDFYKGICASQFRMKEQLMYTNARLQKLRRFFADEWEAYRFDLAVSSDKQSKALARQFKYFRWDYADKLLLLYLERCKERHWLTFIQHRSTLEDADIKDL